MNTFHETNGVNAPAKNVNPLSETLFRSGYSSLLTTVLAGLAAKDASALDRDSIVCLLCECEDHLAQIIDAAGSDSKLQSSLDVLQGLLMIVHAAVEKVNARDFAIIQSLRCELERRRRQRNTGSSLVEECANE